MINIYSPPKKRGLSYQNEPEKNCILTANFRTYPDMHLVYKSFADKMDLDSCGLLLGNGYENVMKNVLLALKPKTMYWSKPAWGVLDIYCKQFNIKKINNKFIYKNGKFSEPPINTNIKYDIYYTTLPANNEFVHDNNINPNIFKKFKYVIIDISYSKLDNIKKHLSEFNQYKNVIVIGSFDKLYGCGLRIGFATFNSTLEKKILLYKERCLNSAAADFIIHQTFIQPTNEYLDMLLYDFKNIIVSYTANYILLNKNYNISIRCEHIKLSNKHQFTKIGIPNNNEEYDVLKKQLSEVI